MLERAKFLVLFQGDLRDSWLTDTNDAANVLLNSGSQHNLDAVITALVVCYTIRKIDRDTARQDRRTGINLLVGMRSDYLTKRGNQRNSHTLDLHWLHEPMAAKSGPDIVRAVDRNFGNFRIIQQRD
ncbi:hypothetical protein D3C85_1330940 [compost metagenome]